MGRENRVEEGVEGILWGWRRGEVAVAHCKLPIVSLVLGPGSRKLFLAFLLAQEMDSPTLPRLWCPATGYSSSPQWLLQPFPCSPGSVVGLLAVLMPRVSALWLLLCRASGAFWSPFLQACGDVRLPGWILCLCGMFSIWWLNSQCCKAGMREKRYEKERCLQETTKDRISKNPVFFLRAAHDTRPGQMSLPIIHTYL